MKIILLTTFYKPSVGGVERQVEEIFLNLKRGHNVRVFTTDASHSTNKRLKNVPVEHGVERFKYLFGFGFFFRFSLSLVINLLFTDFDIVHVHNSHDAHLLPALLIKIIRRKKIVITGHNPYVVDKSKRKERLSKGVIFFDSILKIFRLGVDKYIALLESEKQFVNNYLKIPLNKIDIIPNGIKDPYYKEVRRLNSSNLFYTKYNLNKDNYKLVAGLLCRVDFVKGIQNLKTAVNNNPDCLFIIGGGDGGYLESLKEMFKKNSNIFFTGEFLNVNESLDFYAFIDIFLLPSVYEPFGITIVEAMTQGKYILASSKGGPREIIKGEYGEVLDPLNEQIWSDRINDIKESIDVFTTKGQLGIKDSLEYKWERITDKLVSLYKSI